LVSLLLNRDEKEKIHPVGDNTLLHRNSKHDGETQMSKKFIAMVMAAVLSGALCAYAHTSVDTEQVTQPTILAEEANLIFIGDVIEVTYLEARIEGSDSNLPYTVVTYRVKDVLRGKPPGETFTMRFPGGTDGRGGFVEVSGVPVFEKGDQDLLFVRSNGEQGCPLVGCEWGRFRILNGAVYNTHGSPVRGFKESHIIARGLPPAEFQKFSYPAPTFDHLTNNPEVQRLLRAKGISLEEARKHYESEAPKQIEVRKVYPEMQTRTTPDQLATVESGLSGLTAPKTAAEIAPTASGLDQFVSMIKDAIDKSSRAPVALKSIDPKAEIILKLSGPQAAPAPPELKAETATSTPEEAAEIKALKAQDFNPVIRK
jgi:hypothetical protein